MKTLSEIINEAVKMQNLFPTAIEAKVAAVNKVNRLALDVLPIMHEAIRPFIGKVVQNQGHDLQKRFFDALPKDDCAGRGGYCLQWCYKTSPYALRADFQTNCSASQHFTERAEVCITLADLERRTLKALCSEGLALKMDYTPDWVYQARKEADATEQAARKALSTLTFAGFERYRP